jgi:ribosomal protein S18 acetylase RimI-like enzyme
VGEHTLDRPVWNALSTRQSEVAVGDGLARRFRPEVGPLAASCDDDSRSLDALAALTSPASPLILLQADPIVVPPEIEIVMAAPGVQMVAERLAPMPTALGDRIVRLGAEELPEMLALAALTRPGPFEAGTPRLGEFLGIKEEGRLVAMAGERMKHAGYTEVSGVCTHPSARGRGYARALSIAVATRILDRGEIPYLHAYAANAAAIQLYRALGFRLRRPVHVAFVTRRAGNA